MVEQDEELRAHSALIGQDAAERVVEGVIARAPDADPRTVGLVASALAAAASRCVRERAAQIEPTSDLQEHIRRGVGPLVEELGPLLP